MRSRVIGVIVIVMLMLSALIWSGCSKQPQPPVKDVRKSQSQYSGAGGSRIQSQYSSKDAGKAQSPPSDEDIIKAIDDSGIMTRADGSFTVVPPINVVEKGKFNKNGSWPVKVKFTLKYKMKDGRISQPTETTSLFSISEAKDNMGKSVWKARLGS